MTLYTLMSHSKRDGIAREQWTVCINVLQSHSNYLLLQKEETAQYIVIILASQ